MFDGLKRYVGIPLLSVHIDRTFAGVFGQKSKDSDMDGLDEDAAQRLRALQILQSCWVAKNFMLLSMKQCGNSVIGPFAYWQSYVNPDIKQMGTMGSRHLGADCWSPA